MAIVNEAEYLIRLLNAVIKKEQPEELPERLSFELLFKLASFHSVANTAFYGIEKLKRKPESELLKKWAEVRDKEIIKDITQTTELYSIISAFDKAEIRFIILKGSHLKTLYPQSDFRSMSDIDIYIEDADTEKAKTALLSLGYEINRLEQGVHDVYYKKPVMNIEVHRDLFGEGGQEFAPIFTDLWSKSELVEKTCYNLSPDYFFSYVLAHGIKHYDNGGSGIRTFMDIYIYLSKMGSKLNMEKIEELFESVGKKESLMDFIRLSEIWFGEGEYTDKYREMERYIIRGGTYGTFTNQTIMEMKGKSKGAFLFGKLFPKLSYMQEQFPVLRKAPVLLPVFWLVRMVKAVTVNRKQNAEKFKAFRDN